MDPITGAVLGGYIAGALMTTLTMLGTHFLILRRDRKDKR